MAKYFTINELCVSASYPALVVVPKEGTDIFNNLQHLMVQLDTVREKYGKPIIVTSGYRPKALNDKVSKAKNSLHTKGAAADIHSKDGYSDNINILKAVIESGVVFDELIAEYPTFDKNGVMTSCKWVHFGYLDGKMRKAPMYFDGKAYRKLNINVNYSFKK